MRHSIRGLIIRDRKILLVTGHGADYYWTPGGGVEPGETSEETLHREIMEELGVRIRTLVLYLSYDYEDQRVENYLIEIIGDIKSGDEVTGISWYSSESTLRPSNGFKDVILPRLLQEGLID